MNYRTIAFIAFVNVLGLLSVGDGSAMGLGLLTPLLPIAQITGHAGLWAHGLTGAALLKLKAAAALSGLFLLSGRGLELNLGNNEETVGWGSGGWGSGGWGSGWDSSRKKRSISRHDSAPEPDQEFDPSLDQVLAFDQFGCGMRLICELSATPFMELGEDEKVILELFGRDSKAPLPGKMSKGKLTYSYASILGLNAKDGAETCGRVYGQCPYSRVQIMQSLREVQV